MRTKILGVVMIAAVLAGLAPPAAAGGGGRSPLIA